MRTPGIVALATVLASALSASGPVGAAEKPLAGYTVLVVEDLTIEEGELTKDFDPLWAPLLHKGMMRQLEKKKAFPQLVDAPGAAAATGKRLILSNRVVEYSKGNRAARMLVGWGAGAAKMRIQFVFKDAETGAELFRTEREGKYAGWLSGTGGTKEEAVIESAGDVVDRLLDDIKKQR